MKNALVSWLQETIVAFGRISAAGKDRLGWGLLFVLHMEEERGITAGENFRLA